MFRLRTLYPYLLLVMSPALLLAAEHNLSRVVLADYPQVSVATDPSTGAPALRATFSVFPYSTINPKAQLSGLMEKHALYALRNAMEARGYRFVSPDASPDFLATIEVRSDYKEKYIPPRTVTFPDYVSGQTVKSTWQGSVSTWGQNYGWGTFSGSTATELPGYWTTRSFTKRGYTVGFFYPAVGVYLLDGNSLDLVWEGRGVATSHEFDPRIAMQVVLRYVVEEVPRCRYTHDSSPTAPGRVGARLWVYTNDGNTYYPTVLDVVKESSAERVGLKQYDMVSSINGNSTANRPYSDVLAMMAGAPSAPVALGVRRADRTVSMTVARDQRHGPSLPPAPVRLVSASVPVVTQAKQSSNAPVSAGDSSPERSFEVVVPATGNQLTLRQGMTLADVARLLGPADWKYTFQEMTRWDYKGFSVIFERDRLLRVTRP